MRTRRIAVSVAPVLTLVLAATRPAGAAQVQERTVWDGVYTQAQAARGKAQYETTCRSCHGGGPRKDDEFMRDWSGSDVRSLFKQVKTSMPPGAPSSLSDAAVSRRAGAAGGVEVARGRSRSGRRSR